MPHKIAFFNIIYTHQVHFFFTQAIHHIFIQVFGLLNDIRHNSTGCRQFSCPASIEHRVSQHITMHKNAIENIVHTVKLTGWTHQVRGHLCIHLISYFTAGSQQLHCHPQLFRILHIHRSDLRNSFRGNLLKIHELSIGQRR